MFFAPKHSKARGLQSQVRRLKKLEPPLDKVIKFVTSNAAGKINATENEQEVRSILGRREQNILYTAAIGGVGLVVGLVVILGWRFQRQTNPTSTAPQTSVQEPKEGITAPSTSAEELKEEPESPEQK